MKALDQHTQRSSIQLLSIHPFDRRVFHKLFIHKIYEFYLICVLFSFFFVSFSCSLGPLETLPREMVSRRKILSRSRDDLNLEHHQHQYVTQDDEEDIWYQKDKLYKVSFHPNSSISSSQSVSMCPQNTKRTQFPNRQSLAWYCALLTSHKLHRSDSECAREKWVRYY